MRALLRRYLRNRKGNFAVVTALLSVPLVMGVGLMVDITQISQKKTEMQQALDAAALSLAREGKLISDNRAYEVAKEFLDAHLGTGYANLQVVRVDNQFKVTATSKAGLSFGAVFGIRDMTVAGASTAELAYADYEMALVLDTTGSMQGGKLASMKDAVIGMIDTMSSQVNDPDKLKYALVPFSQFVNVGPQYAPQFDDKNKQIKDTGAPWLDVAGKSQIQQIELTKGASRFQVYKNTGNDWPGCVETRAQKDDLDINDVTPNPKKPDTLFVPMFAIDEPDTGGFVNSYIQSTVNPFDNTSTGKKKKLAKYGIATDDDGNPLLEGVIGLVDGVLGLDLLGNGTVKTNEGNGRGPGRGCAVQPITPLSNDYSALKAKVRSLQANGNTNIMEGVAWGWRVLSPNEPFTQGSDPAKKKYVQKVMIVLTDGSNVMGNNSTSFGSSYSSMGYLVDGRLGVSTGTSTTTNDLMNKRTLAACENAKKEGATIYTIRLEEPDVKTGYMLKECASSPDKFFDAPSRTQLDEVFAKIKDQIVMVRIAS